MKRLMPCCSAPPPPSVPVRVQPLWRGVQRGGGRRRRRISFSRLFAFLPPAASSGWNGELGAQLPSHQPLPVECGGSVALYFFTTRLDWTFHFCFNKTKTCCSFPTILLNFVFLFPPGCEDLASQFLSQEIDGQALLLLKEEHLMSTMNIKLGPALKICAHINNLKDWPSLQVPGSDVELVLTWWQTCRWMFEVRFISAKPAFSNPTYRRIQLCCWFAHSGFKSWNLHICYHLILPTCKKKNNFNVKLYLFKVNFLK